MTALGVSAFVIIHLESFKNVLYVIWKTVEFGVFWLWKVVEIKLINVALLVTVGFIWTCLK